MTAPHPMDYPVDFMDQFHEDSQNNLFSSSDVAGDSSAMSNEVADHDAFMSNEEMRMYFDFDYEPLPSTYTSDQTATATPNDQIDPFFFPTANLAELATSTSEGGSSGTSPTATNHDHSSPEGVATSRNKSAASSDTSMDNHPQLPGRQFVGDIISFEKADEILQAIYDAKLKHVKVPGEDDHDKVAGADMMAYQERIYDELYTTDMVEPTQLKGGEVQYFKNQQGNVLAKVLKKTETHDQQQAARAYCCKLLMHIAEVHTEGAPAGAEEGMTCSERVELVIKAVKLKTVAHDVIKGETQALRDLAMAPETYVKKKITLLQSNYTRLMNKMKKEGRTVILPSDFDGEDSNGEPKPKEKTARKTSPDDETTSKETAGKKTTGEKPTGKKAGNKKSAGKKGEEPVTKKRKHSN